MKTTEFTGTVTATNFILSSDEKKDEMKNLNETNKTVMELNSKKRVLAEAIESFINNKLHEFQRDNNITVAGITIDLGYQKLQKVYPSEVAKVDIDFGIKL